MVHAERRENFPGDSGREDFRGEAAGAEALRVLVVDDVEVNRELFALFLGQEKVEVFLASGGKEALEIYDRKNPGCLFLDLRMPGMDGLEVAMEIRRREARNGRASYLAGMSGGDPEADRLCCEAAGMNEFLPKPVTAEHLREVLERCGLSGRKKEAAEPPRGKTSGGKKKNAGLYGELDLGKMLDLLRGNWSLLKMAVESRFLPQIRRDLDDLETLLAQGNFLEAERVAHKIKGNLGYFGGREMIRLPEEIRALCLESKGAAAEEAFRRLGELCGSLDKLFSRKHWESSFSTEGKYQGTLPF